MGFAPFFISSFEPLKHCSPACPGIAKTSLPCSAAYDAVISEPLFSLAYTTAVPIDSPEIILFLMGKEKR